MIRHKRLEHRFVKHVPETLEPAVLYVSMDYGSVVHACCCGCGAEVVTPLTPTDWLLTFDGESISLWPSIGSWSLPCRSHYVIDRNRVLVAGKWNNHQIDAERRRDQVTKARHYGSVEVVSSNTLQRPTNISKENNAGWFARIIRSLFG